MVSTRIKTGAIARTRYDYASLQLKGEKIEKEQAPQSKRGRSKTGSRTGRPKKGQWPVIQVNNGQKGVRQRDDVVDPSKWEALGFDFPAEFDSKLPVPNSEDISEGVNFTPGCSFGAGEKAGQSAIQRADEEIRKWEIVKSHHEEHLPRVVPMIDLRIKEAREARDNLEDNEVNNRIADEDAISKTIQRRIEVLEKFLAESQFELERENMRCAIQGYKSGEIAYASHYTLIYAGRIVDTAESYGDFTADRTQRLDRYEKNWGPHWLWYERGLLCPPNLAPRSSRSVALARANASNNLGLYYVNQCFWKRAGWVSRMPQVQLNADIPAELSREWMASKDGQVYCQQEGPKLVFESLLDSGATFPSLHPSDFPKLGIDPKYYAAQTIEEILTANGILHMRCFEMFVSIVDGNLQELVDPADAVWSTYGKYIGGLCPVLMTAVEPVVDEMGYLPNARLSGFLPFAACYTSISPTMNTLFFGEDRNDVLGFHRIPGHKRWEIGMPTLEPLGKERWGQYSNPKIRFVHNRGLIMDADRDDRNHASTVIYNIGHPTETRIECDPVLIVQEEANRKAAVAAAAGAGAGAVGAGAAAAVAVAAGAGAGAGAAGVAAAGPAAAVVAGAGPADGAAAADGADGADGADAVTG